MKIDVSNISIEKYDVVIVGSGPAGCVLADRMSKANKRCLIIETGKTRFNAEIQAASSNMKADGHYDSSYWPLHWIRSFGGTSTVWAGWVATLDDRDFATWPITGSELAPYYIIASEIMGRSSTMVDYLPPHIEGFLHKPFSVPLDNHWRADQAYDSFLSSSRKVDVLCESTVTELIVNDERNHVSGVWVSTLPDLRTKIELSKAQTLVLAAGGMGNAQLMLAPSGESLVGVGNETDMAGRCLMEHPHLNDVGRVIFSDDLSRPAIPTAFGEYEDAIIPDDDLYERVGKRSVSLEITQDSPNIDDPTERYLLGKFGQNADIRRITVRSEMLPHMENRVQLTDELDSSGLPKINATCIVSGDDFRAVHTCLTTMGQSLAEKDLGRVRIDNDILFRGVSGGGHIMGTTRMGDDPRTSVVDKNCRAHKYQNLYVAGSSVFTTGGASNPTLTIAALSARLADHLLGAT